MAKNISDQDYKLFINTVRRVSKYDLSDYSDKSLKRRIAKVFSDNKTDINSLIYCLDFNNLSLCGVVLQPVKKEH